MSAAAGLAALVPAVITALKAQSSLTTLLDSASAVYDGDSPNPTQGAQPVKYLVVRTPSFVPTGVFSSIGADNVIEIHIWHPGKPTVPVLAIVREIGVALDGVKLSLGGSLRHWTGETSLLAILDDPGKTPAEKHGIVSYASRTQ